MNQTALKCHFTLSSLYHRTEYNVLSVLIGGSQHTRLLDSQSNKFTTLISHDYFLGGSTTGGGETYCWCRLVMFRLVPHSSKGCWDLISVSVGRKKKDLWKQEIYSKISHLKSNLLISHIGIISISLKWSELFCCCFRSEAWRWTQIPQTKFNSHIWGWNKFGSKPFYVWV